jgi:hypothetical protein
MALNNGPFLASKVLLIFCTLAMLNGWACVDGSWDSFEMATYCCYVHAPPLDRSIAMDACVAIKGEACLHILGWSR